MESLIPNCVIFEDRSYLDGTVAKEVMSFILNVPRGGDRWRAVHSSGARQVKRVKALICNLPVTLIFSENVGELLIFENGSFSFEKSILVVLRESTIPVETQERFHRIIRLNLKDGPYDKFELAQLLQSFWVELKEFFSGWRRANDTPAWSQD